MADRSTIGETRSLGPGQSRGFQLVVMANEMFAVHPLPKEGVVVLGRSPVADIPVDDPHVSRRHAQLHLGDQIEIEDLAGRNGTFVRGERLPTRQRVSLAPGEAVELGQSIVVLQLRHGAGAQRPALPEGLGSDVASALRRIPSHVVIADPAMRRLYGVAATAATSLINVLILGETGAGKDLLAETIHACSGRLGGPLVSLNCAEFAESLLETELFGHEKGAFTGALHAKPGLLESASGGTVFLDEVGDMSAGVQARLLRVLETREVRRVGAVRGRTIDVRIISATNRDLAADIQRGKFRKDLYFRLNGLTLYVPPLRERKADIAPLAAHFVVAASRKLQPGREPPGLTAAAVARLEQHRWPGNVRELRTVIERALVLSRKSDIAPEHLIFDPLTGGDVDAGVERADEQRAEQRAAPVARTPPPPPDEPRTSGGIKDEMADLEQKRILDALEKFGGNQTRAARHLKLSRRTLVKRLDAYGVVRPRKPQAE
jgi:two-component system, NtrC family, response regulator AtoC